MLRELDLDFEYVQADPTKGEHRRPGFLAVNPAGKVPVLVDDDFLDMAAVMEKHLETRPVLVGDNVTVADFVAAYTLDMASVVDLLEALPNLRAYMERMYARPKARSASHRRSRASAAEAPARGCDRFSEADGDGPAHRGIWRLPYAIARVGLSDRDECARAETA